MSTRLILPLSSSKRNRHSIIILLNSNARPSGKKLSLNLTRDTSPENIRSAGITKNEKIKKAPKLRRELKSQRERRRKNFPSRISQDWADSSINTLIRH
jgi:hypothetical protein